jgi:5-formyltetrahydrofolate cyclo-ligase
MVVPSPSKSGLRSDALARRRSYARSLTPELRDDLEVKLKQIVLPRLLHARTVAGYYPMRDEISPLPILDAAAAGGQAAALPWFADRDARMMFRRYPATEPSPWGVLQPPGEADAVAPDVVLVPLVAADRHGTRIGHGKGHYDRALAHLREAGPVFTIGIGWEFQVVEDAIAGDPWDVPLDAIATPAEWIDCR